MIEKKKKRMCQENAKTRKMMRFFKKEQALKFVQNALKLLICKGLKAFETILKSG